MRRTRKNAFTLIEVMLAVAVLALLMAAVAAAVHGSLSTCSENDKMASLSQASRFVLNRICREVRTAEDVDQYAGSTTLRLIPISDGSGLQQVQYTYDSGAKSLRCTRTVNGAATTQTLLGGGDGVSVTGFAVTYVTGKDYKDVTCTKSVTVRLECKVGARAFAMTASADPRRNLLY